MSSDLVASVQTVSGVQEMGELDGRTWRKCETNVEGGSVEDVCIAIGGCSALCGQFRCRNHVVKGALRDFVELIVSATMVSLKVTDVRACRINTRLSIVDALDDMTDLRLHQSGEGRIGLLGPTCSNDAQVVLVVLGEE